MRPLTLASVTSAISLVNHALAFTPPQQPSLRQPLARPVRASSFGSYAALASLSPSGPASTSSTMPYSLAWSAVR